MRISLPLRSSRGENDRPEPVKERTGFGGSFRMRSCARKSQLATPRRMSFWSSAIRRARIAWPARFWAANPTRAMFRRTPSSGSTNPPIASTADRASRPGSTECWSTCASITNGVTNGGDGLFRFPVPPTIPMRPRSIPHRPSPGLRMSRCSASQRSSWGRRSSAFLPISESPHGAAGAGRTLQPRDRRSPSGARRTQRACISIEVSSSCASC